jgi:hypothetical protein
LQPGEGCRRRHQAGADKFKVDNSGVASRKVVDHYDTIVKTVIETKLVDGEETGVEKEVETQEPVYTEVPEYGRNLTATTSALTEVVKDLIKRIEALEK